MGNRTISWIKAILANDEVSTDEELVEHFITEGGLTHEEAKRWIVLRQKYLQEIFCNAEPEEQMENNGIIQLPTFKGYTIDLRLREFRKAVFGKSIEFVEFDSPKGKKLLSALKEISPKISLYRKKA